MSKVSLQLAGAICYTSGVLHYADKPELYLASGAADVIKAIPAAWDETIVLPGSKIGRLAVLARRKGDTWFVGLINGAGAVDYDLSLSFLSADRYRSIQLADDPSRPDKLVRTEAMVKAKQTIPVRANDVACSDPPRWESERMTGTATTPLS